MLRWILLTSTWACVGFGMTCVGLVDLPPDVLGVSIKFLTITHVKKMFLVSS